MKNSLYHILVNRQAGIRQRYHRMHDGATGILKVISWCYLLWLNLCYYVFFCRFLSRPEKVAVYEEKRLSCVRSESEEARIRCQRGLFGKKRSGLQNKSLISGDMVQQYIAYLSRYDVISFDLFDTLIFRPFSAPDDLFFLMGEKQDFLDFKRIRIEMEARARRKKSGESGNYEVTLADIWNLMKRETGLEARAGEILECETEKELCYANPFMLRVFQGLREKDKTIVVTTDMYLPQACLEELLTKNGYHGAAAVYLSSACGQSKWDGGLFDVMHRDLQRKYGEKVRIIHIGDNLQSDVKMAKKHGIASLYYPNTDILASACRAQDMSPLIGGAYRGIVNHWLNNGLCVYSMEYEYGFIYGGLFAVGYCTFIHDYVRKNGIDRVLFLSRDGDILRQVYTLLYPEDKTQYVYWSRAAALKLTADENRYDFFRRFLYHKINQRRSLAQILREMELEGLTVKLPMEKEAYLTSENVEIVKEALLMHWEEVLLQYQEQVEAAGRYYAKVLSGSQKAAAVDIGWAGSGAMALRVLCRKQRIPCELVGILAGTNSIHNAEPDTSEAQLQSGTLVSYLFSQSFNRDVLKKHDPAADDNVYWELLLSSPTRQFIGFYPCETGIKLRFGAMPANVEGCREIQRGIVDFAKAYQRRFASYPYMFSVSGRDACAPMLAAYGYNRKYLKKIASRMEMDISVSCGGESVEWKADI